MRIPLLICLVGAAAATAQQRAEAIDAELIRHCQPLIAAELAVGLAVGVLDGEVAVQRGFGLVEAGGSAVPTERTVYEIGSVSKVFTGLLLADAVERGLVALEDPVQRHLPDSVRMPQLDGKEVLLRHLTTHTSGLPRLPYGEPPDPQDPYAHLDTEHLYAALAEVLLRHEPGSRYEYSNLGAGLLGHVLARKDGAASYDQLLRTRICAPLGLDDTAVRPGAALQQRLAPPYDSEGDPAHNWDLAELAGAGGIRSTVADLLQFARANLRPEGALAAAIARAQVQLFADQGVAIGCGWHLDDGGRTLWHNGATGGYHAFFAVQPTLRRAVCILGNTPRNEIDDIGRLLLRYLEGASVRPLQIEPAVAVDRALLAPLVGVYRLSAEVQIEVTLRARGLYCQMSHQPAFRLFARSPREFFLRVAPAAISFEPETGAVQALVLHQNGRDARFARQAGAAVK